MMKMIKKCLSYLYLLIFILLLYNSSSFGYSFRKLSRPRLFLTWKKIQFIKSKLHHYPYLKFWLYVKKRADSYAKENPPLSAEKYDDNTIRGLGNRLPYMALAYLLTGNNLYLNGVKKWMNALCSYPSWASNEDLGAAHILFGMSICYDWLYNEFTPKEREHYKNKMIKHAKIFYNLLINKKKWWAKAYLQNHNYTNVMALAITGIALYGEAKEAKNWLIAAEKNFKQVISLLSPDGATHEGVGYWSYGTEALLKYYMAIALFSGLNNVKNSQYFKHTAYFRLHMSMPDFKEIVNYGDSPYYDWYGPGYILRCLAHIFNNSYAQWLAEKIEKSRKQKARYSWLDLIWYNENITPISPNKLPNYAFFKNLGFFVNRTSWKPNSVWTFFKAGYPLGELAYNKWIYRGAGHVHPDEGNFLLWAYGKWLIVDDGYSYHKSTINHNVFTFNGFGQLGEGKKWFNMSSVKKYHGNAEIIYTDFKPKYKYIIADMTKIYPPEANLVKWQRIFIVLPKGYILIKDDIELKNKGYAEHYIHLGPGYYLKKIEKGFIYKDINVGLYINELYGNPLSFIQYTNFIGKRFKEDNSRYTIKFYYSGKKFCNILLLRPWSKGNNPKNLNLINVNKNFVEFSDKFFKIKVNFLTKKIIISKSYNIH